jgi:single-strand DNA-binding protein
MLNVAAIVGRLTADPELKHTTGNVPVVSFTLAVGRSYAKAGTERQTDFIDVVAWRSTAEFVSKYFTKGRMAVVEGRLQIRDWTDRDGGKRRTAEVIADNVYFGDSRRDGADNGGYAPAPAYGAPVGRGYSAPAGGHSEFAEIGEEDGDLPF